MDKNELISIVVPVYNVAKFIAQCVDSILAQTYQNIEILLVDDGSTDDSGKICDKLLLKDERIRVIHKENGGLSDARNAGIKVARGEYIGFVDSDDWIEPDMYEKLYNACKENNAEISVCGLFRDYVDKTVNCPSVPNKVYSAEEAFRELIEGENLHDHSWSKLYKTSLFGNIEFPKGKVYEDIRTTYKLFLSSNKVVSIEDCLYHYRQRSGSIVRTTFNKNSFQLLDAIIELFNQLDVEVDKYKKELDHRVLKTKCYIIRDMLLCGKSCISEYKDEFNDYYDAIKANRKVIFHDNRFTKVYKLLAGLSCFPPKLTEIIFSTGFMKKYIGDRYKYFK